MIQRPHLLISDDDRDFRETLRDAFVARGFRTSVAGDGEEALALIESSEIHLALLDHHMPRLTGVEVIRQIQTRGSRLPCILVSAGLTPEILASLEPGSVFSVLKKPVNFAELSNTVRATLESFYQWTPRN